MNRPPKHVQRRYIVANVYAICHEDFRDVNTIQMSPRSFYSIEVSSLPTPRMLGKLSYYS